MLKNVDLLLDKINLRGQKFVRENYTNLVAEAWDVANTSKNLTFTSDGDGVVSSVKLPGSLLKGFKKEKRITFVSYANDNFFPMKGALAKKKIINSQIVSSNIKVLSFGHLLRLMWHFFMEFLKT